MLSTRLFGPAILLFSSSFFDVKHTRKVAKTRRDETSQPKTQLFFDINIFSPNYISSEKLLYARTFVVMAEKFLQSQF
jgi:hypothetical protein